MNPYAQKNDRGHCTCGGCGRKFSGLSTFDAHRVRIKGTEYDWRCASDDELIARRLVLRGGVWRSVEQNPRFTPGISTESDFQERVG